MSVALTMLGLIIGGLIYNGKLSGGACGEWGMGCLVYGVMAFSGLCFLGFVAAIVAYFRREKMPAVTWVSLILNGLLVLTFLVVFMMIALK
jgi:hypothetical protein